MVAIKGISTAQRRLRNFSQSTDVSFTISLSEEEIFSSGRITLDSAEAAQLFIKELEQWCDQASSDIRISAGFISSTLSSSITPRIISNRLGEPTTITFSFLRHGIYLEKGAGRGYGGHIGSSWNGKHTNPNSIGKMGTGKKPPKQWYNPTIQKDIDSLGDIVARYMGDKAIQLITL